MRRSRTGNATAALAATLVHVPAASAGPQARRAAGDDTQKVTDETFADPGFMKDGDTYYLYRTGDFGVATSSSATSTFEVQGPPAFDKDDMPRWFGPRTDVGSHRWAPDVIEHDGRYLMYYSASQDETKRDCAGVAVSDSPTQGFAPADVNEAPLVCVSNGTVIDPSVFESDKGPLFLVDKVRKYNDPDPDTYSIKQLPLTSDGLSVKPDATPKTLVNGGTQIIDAPVVVKHDDRLWLFVSRNNYLTGDARTRYTWTGVLRWNATTGAPFMKPAETVSAR